MNKNNKKPRLLYAALGAAAGLLNGFFGSGGGALLVPAAKRFLGIKPHEAHASVVAIMLSMTAVSVIFYIPKMNADIWQVLLVSAGGLIGGFAGAKLLPRLSPLLLRRVFGVLLAAAGIKMVL